MTRPLNLCYPKITFKTVGNEVARPLDSHFGLAANVVQVLVGSRVHFWAPVFTPVAISL